MSNTCLLMVLFECACANLISKANFNLLNRLTCLFICMLCSKSHSKILRDKKVIASFGVFGQNFCSEYSPGCIITKVVSLIYSSDKAFLFHCSCLCTSAYTWKLNTLKY